MGLTIIIMISMMMGKKRENEEPSINNAVYSS
jgi:hypothetical protein